MANIFTCFKTYSLSVMQSYSNRARLEAFIRHFNSIIIILFFLKLFLSYPRLALELKLFDERHHRIGTLSLRHRDKAIKVCTRRYQDDWNNKQGYTRRPLALGKLRTRSSDVCNRHLFCFEYLTPSMQSSSR